VALSVARTTAPDHRRLAAEGFQNRTTLDDFVVGQAVAGADAVLAGSRVEVVGRVGFVQHRHKHAVALVLAQPAPELDRDLALELAEQAHDLAGTLREARRMTHPVHGQLEVVEDFLFEVVFVLENFISLLALVTVVGGDLELDGGASAGAGFGFGGDDGVCATFHLHERIFFRFCEVNARCPKDLRVHLSRK
jgi:hypothetical protein